ncbi:MAG TPA: CHAT domain-containing protein [Thermoanaerobaculia bacterium]|nr:CHAT domain-containing protein [Thermoanaerobaculia bacterium]
MEVLARWGAAVLEAKNGDADRHLSVARALAAAVQRNNGDAAFKEAVDAIAAAENSPVRLALAEAHVVYRSALQAFQSNRPGEAEPLLRRAARLFESGQSPMALAARYFAANTVLEQGRVADAERELDALLESVPSRFPSYRAQVQWQLGACYVSRGEWGMAVTTLEQGADAFERLGETQNAGAARRLLAFAYERVGDPDRAWTQYMKVLQRTGRRSTLHLVKALASIADAALRRRDWETAVSFLGIEVAVARRIGNDVQFADALCMRAAARVRMGDERGAADDLATAEQSSARIRDAAYREHLRLAALRVRAMLARSPREAVALLTNALSIQRTMGDRINVPGLLLERARALRSSGDYAAAGADVAEGIALVETYRQSLDAGEARWGAFHAAEELFHEGIALELERNNAAAALAFAESGRARTLLESYGRSPAVRSSDVPRGTVIVEYAVLPRHLVIFTVDSAEVRAIQIPIGRDRLAGEIAAIGAAMQSGDEAAAMRALVTVAERVVHAVEPQLLQANTVVFVPDAVTAAIPFAALPDRSGAFVIEQFEVVTAPSAALHLAAAERRARAVRPESVLVVSNSSPRGESGRLEYVGREAERVSAAYSRATQLGEAMAQYELLAAQAEATDVLHIAAHAIGDDSGLEPASIAMRDAQGKERHVGVQEVARLKLRPTATVVLAGCDTARGEKRATEGVISLAYGFLTAGAPSVIATLWPVDDGPAAAFFPRIHQSLAAGIPPARALREAQLQAVRAGNFPISIWAALQCIGS